MSILSKLMDTMRFSPDEDEEYFGPDDDYEAEKPAKRGRFPAREESESYDDGSEEKPRFFSRSSKVVPTKRSMEVSMVKPTSIEDAREICDYFQRCLHLLLIGLAQGHQRHTAGTGCVTDAVHSVLNRNGIHIAEQGLCQLKIVIH